jgi:hypothetical protein
LSTNAAGYAAISIAEWPVSWFAPKRYRPGNLGIWSGHLAFAHDLIKALDPSLLVELGTHWGESYFTFCQTVAEANISCSCYSVDHWRGESHSGSYEEEVYKDVAAYNEANYKSFSYLLKMRFDEAIGQFADASIDLLDIDGLHTYDAVEHDFRTWLPKVKPGGIILLHDIMARHEEFGVWRLWDELKQQFTDAFEFRHQWGLGILRKPGGTRRGQPFLETLFHADPNTAESIRRYYVIYGSHLENLLRPRPAIQHSGHFQAGLFVNRAGAYAENEAIWQSIQPGEWQRLVFNLDTGTGDGPLRFCPSDSPCRIEVEDFRIVAADTNEILWRGNGIGDAGVETAGTLIELPGVHKPTLISTDVRPALLLPVPRINRHVRFEAAARISVDFLETYQALSSMVSDSLKEMQVAQNERISAQTNLSRTLLRLGQAEDELQRLGEHAAIQERELSALRSIRDRTAELNATLNGILNSLSWKITAPIRKISETLRRAR